MSLGRTQSRSAARMQRSWLITAGFVDATALAGAALAERLGTQAASGQATSGVWIAAFAPVILLLFAVRGMYRLPLRLSILDDIRTVVTVTALAGMTVLSLRVLFGAAAFAGGQTARVWAFTTVYLVAGRVALDLSEKRARRRSRGLCPTLIVGAGRVGRLTARRLLQEPEFGLAPVGFLDKEPTGEEDAELPVLGSSWDLEEVVSSHDIGHVVLAFSTAPHDVMLRIARRCEQLGVSVSYVPRLFEQVGERVRVDHLGGLPLLAVERAHPNGWRFQLKYILDRVVAAVLLVLLLPVLLAAALAVWLSLGRPVLFRQLRVGQDGRPFNMLKFRTMRAERGSPDPGRDVSLPPDTAPGGVEGQDRRTGIGSLLRRTSLDELPQLLNVLRGEMSLVGPRPERPEFVSLFSESVYRYPERHRVKAGITGWAQVNGLRGKTSLSDRVEWDNYYIENWSLWLDMRIMVTTLRAIIDGRRIE